MAPRSHPGPARHALARASSASWEALLLVVAAAVFAANALASPYFLDLWNLCDATFNFTEKAIIALAMAFVVMAGEIDLSVGGIVALASTAMGAAAQPGLRHARAGGRSGSASGPAAGSSTGSWWRGSACPRSWRPSAR